MLDFDDPIPAAFGGFGDFGVVLDPASPRWPGDAASPTVNERLAFSPVPYLVGAIPAGEVVEGLAEVEVGDWDAVPDACGTVGVVHGCFSLVDGFGESAKEFP